MIPYAPAERNVQSDIQGEGTGTGELLSEAEVISILVVRRALFRAPLVVVSRRCELVVNTKWLV